MSQGPSVSWSVSRSLRATDQKASESGSSPAESGPAPTSLAAGSRSWVTGIAYQGLLLYPHIEVTSVLSIPSIPAERSASWHHHRRIEISAAGAVSTAR